ncbi:MAG: hypothetical protein LLF83_01105 [Methanobacterium sp.]|nr:hypothetical protein [Methanobacterium sp.]
MKKIATILLLMITLGMVFSGAVSAQDPTTVDVAVTDDNGAPVDVACNGSDVTLAINVSTEVDLDSPYVNITVDPDTGLNIDADNAVMFFNGIKFTNDPLNPFFYWSDTSQSWIWWIGWLDDMDQNDFAQLFVPATVTDTGLITVNGDLGVWDPQMGEYVIIDPDHSYTFLSVPCHHCHGHPCGETVPMQATGSPLAVAALGLLSIIGGAVYGKLR